MVNNINNFNGLVISVLGEVICAGEVFRNFSRTFSI